MTAYDLLVQADSGLAYLSGTPEAPGRVGVSVCDIACGMSAYQEVLRALYARTRGGRGRAVEVSLYGSIADWMNVPYLQLRYGGHAPARLGLQHPTIPPYGAAPCGDGRAILLSIQNRRRGRRRGGGVGRMMELEALLFDTFGTLVDWRGSLIEDLSALGARRGFSADWAAFADAWRGEYVPSMDRVRRGETPWTPLDALHRESFDVLAKRFGFDGVLDEADRVWCIDRWHRLRPWPDTVAGLTRLRSRYILGTLSNGNVRLLLDLARSAPLPMDAIFSAEHFRHPKRDPEVYPGALAPLA